MFIIFYQEQLSSQVQVKITLKTAHELPRSFILHASNVFCKVPISPNDPNCFKPVQATWERRQQAATVRKKAQGGEIFM